MGFLRHDAIVGRPLASLEQNPAYGTALTIMYDDGDVLDMNPDPVYPRPRIFMQHHNK
jgi:hypothetical protein